MRVGRFLRRQPATALVLLAGAVLAPAALAAPPANDGIESAQDLPPFTIPGTTLEATVAADDPATCDGSSATATVWYTTTLRDDLQSTITLSADFPASVSIFSGEPGALSLVGCRSGTGELELPFSRSGGTRYSVMVASVDGDPGGSFWVGALEAPPVIDLAIDRVGRVDRDGLVTITGTAGCGGFSGGGIDVTMAPGIVQRGATSALGGDRILAWGGYTSFGLCPAPATPWIVTFQGTPERPFRVGPASVGVEIHACGVLTSCSEREETAKVWLRRARAGRIAFASDGVPAGGAATPAPATMEIWTVAPDGSDPRRLTTSPAGYDNDDPAWSRAGTRLAFSSSRTGTEQLFTMRADGSGVRPLTRAGGPASSEPSWSVFDRRIAFVRGGDVWVMGPDGRHAVNLTRSTAVESSPAWSPRDDTIAFVRQAAGEPRRIWLMNGVGRHQRDLSGETFGDWDPAWSPDGRRLAFSTLRDHGAPSGAPALWTMDRWGRVDGPLGTSTLGGDGAQPAWSPDGDVVAAVSGGTSLVQLVRGDQLFDFTVSSSGRVAHPDWQVEPSGWHR